MVRTLQTKILFYFLIIALVPIISIASLAVIQSKKAVENGVTQDFKKIAEELYANINRDVLKGFEDIQLLATNPIIAAENISAEKKKVELLKLKQIFRVYEDITLIDVEGEVITSTDYNYRGTWRHKKWFQEALSGSSVISNVHIIPNPFKVILSFTAPVIDKDFNIIAVVSAQLNMENIWEITDSVKIGETGFSFVLDENYGIIAHPDKERILSKVNDDAVMLISDKADFMRYMDNGDNIIGNYFLKEKHKDYRKLSAPSVGWIVLVVQNEKEIFSTVNKLKNQIILFSILLLVIVILLSLSLSRSIAKTN